MILIYEKPNVHTVPLKSGSIVFYPGKNIISEENLNRYKKEYEFDYNHMMNQKIMRIFQKDDRIEMRKLSNEQALDIVENTMDIEELKSFKKEETRELVCEAINKQIDALTMPGENN